MSQEELVSTEDYWEKRYHDGQTGWDRGQVHPALLNWIKDNSLVPGKILIPGCGNGYEVAYLAQLNFDVSAVDFAETPIKEVKEKLDRNNLHANVIQDDFLRLDTTTRFDYIYEQTCLCAIDPSSRKQYEQKAFELLEPGGQLLGLFMQTGQTQTGPPFHCDIDAMKELFSSARWDWSGDPGTRYDHPSGAIFELAFKLAKKPATT